MAIIEIKMPKMGEAVTDGTILKWYKNIGDVIQQDDILLEIGTDKVDTEIPSPYSGKIIAFLANVGDIVPIGNPIAQIETEATNDSVKPSIPTPTEQTKTTETIAEVVPPFTATVTPSLANEKDQNNGFYSPLVLNIAKEENISFEELSKIQGTGKNNRVTKYDILAYLENKDKQIIAQPAIQNPEPIKVEAPKAEPTPTITPSVDKPVEKPAISYSGAHDIVQMDRMRQIIADRMVASKKISAHVTSFVESDVTNLVYWRNRMKNHFSEKEGVGLTFTPLFIEAIAKALKDFPLMNASIEGDKIIVKKDINIGMAVALPDGNLVVPVIHNADQYNIVGLTKKVNELAKKARIGKLTPDDLQGGTYTFSNIGSFGNLMGTPILVQPQVGILAFGSIQKKPAVIETPYGDTLGIRHMMFLSHTYDHRVVDGSLGGMFVKRVSDYLQNFDLERKL